MIVPRFLGKRVTDLLLRFPAVALLGPRQVGKTTLAHEISKNQGGHYLDLENPADRSKLEDPLLYLSGFENKLVILDEVHRIPELFQVLRGLIDRGRQKGIRNGRFLLLGSASMDLLQQSGESLAGRIAYTELAPFDLLEVGSQSMENLWLRGGFAESFLVSDGFHSLDWRNSFIRTYLERDIPQFGFRIPSETLRRFWMMLANSQGGILNAAQLARSLAVDGKTVFRYLDLLVDLMLVRRLQPFHTNTKKRLVKSPKVYVRDSGVVHALLGLQTLDQVLGHPITGTSWEGFVIENLLRVAPGSAIPSFYRTAVGAEIDLILEFPDSKLWAIEIKRGLSPKLERGFHFAREDLNPARSFVVYSGNERYPISKGVDAIGLEELMNLVLESRLH
jgi:uncharacterized protein